MGCCTNFAHFCRTVGVAHFLAPQPRLTFVTPDRRRSVFKADPWPAPFHLGRALLGAHYLTPVEKLRVAWGLLALLRERPDADPPLREWLLAHRQTGRTIDRFWGVVLVSALNETVDRVGLRYARKVFRDGFVRHRDGFTVHVPSVPLGRFYGPELRAWLDRHGVEVVEDCGVKRLTGAVSGVELRDGSRREADWFVLAAPFERVPDLLPPELAADPFFAGAKELAPSPITSVHLWYDRPPLDLPHAVLVDCLGQWVFSRGEVAPASSTCKSWSAPPPLKGLADEVQRRITEELACVPRRAPRQPAAREGGDRAHRDLQRRPRRGPVPPPAGHAGAEPRPRRRLDRHRLAGHDGRGRP